MHGGPRRGVPRNAQLQAPTLPRAVVHRARLEARLGPDTGAAWSLVVGPPGSGKTTLVRSWLEHADSTWAWVTAPPAGRRRPPLAQLIAHAMSELAIDVSYEPDDDRLVELVSVLDTVGEEHSDILLVLDDAHQLESEEWLFVEALLAEAPHGLHTVVVSRVEPPLPLGRQRASGRMAELRARDLVFDETDAVRLFESIAGSPVGSDGPALHQRTEGWATAIRLAATAVRDGADLDTMLDGLVARTSSVAEFLTEEVVDRLPPDERHLLLQAATVDVLEPELCLALTDRSDGHDVLAKMATDGLFVVSFDDGSDRYRFHELLRNLLRLEYRRSDPDGVRCAHRRAAAWYLAQSRAGDAVEHLLAADDHAEAHTLILENLPELYVGSRRGDLGRWLASIPDDVAAEPIARAVDHCAALALTANPQATKWWLSCSERLGPDDDWCRSRLLCIMAIGHAIHGRLAKMRSCWEQGRRLRPPDRRDPLDEVLSTWEVRLEAHLGDPSAAVAMARTLQSAPRELLDDVVVLSLLAGALEAAGEHESAHATAQLAWTHWRDDGEPELPGMVDALVVLAAEARRDRRPDDANGLLDVADGLMSALRAPNMLTALVSLERARLAAALGQSPWRTPLLALAEALRTLRTPTGLAHDPTAPNEHRPLGDWVDRERQAIERSEHVGAEPAHVGTTSVAPGDELTKRELEVLRLLASHRTLPELAAEIYVSRHTVKTHVARIYRKLGVTSRSAAVREGLALGLLGTPSSVDDSR